ncbi:MAG TPA: hypothetical protein DIT55_04070 [Spirochaetaceae bacterium]|jgi:hypothetical protein|nr:hypothetical protein [Spirochaetaceae bacterium]
MISKCRNTVLICLAATAFLTSCVGIDTKVKIARNGSGKVEAEYRLSEELVAFGELEANKAILPVPLTREDVENSLRSAEGLRLDSWSSSKDGTDLLIKTVISFDTLDALMYYLDPRGEMARHTNESGVERISFTVGEKLPRFDPDMKSIAEQAFAPYSFSFMVELPSSAKEASSGHPAVTLRQEDTKVYFEGKMKDIVTSEIPPSMGLAW